MANPVSEEAMIQWRDELQMRLDALNQERTDIERQITAVNLYLGALKGELSNAEPAAAAKPEHKAHRASGGPKAPRGERRAHIMDILRQEPDGYTFNRILEILGVSDGQEKKAVYATLHNMKRKGEIMQNPNKQFVVALADENEPEPVETEAGLVHDETSSPT
jgi:hypothetical protein